MSEFQQQKRQECRDRNSPLLRPTPDITEFIPFTQEEIEDEKIMLDYERELQEKQKSH